MRKLSILLIVVLVTGLVAGMATIGYADPANPENAKANTSFGVGGNLSLKITDGNSVWFGKSLEIGQEHNKDNATTLKVETNMSIEWEITTSKSVLSRPEISGVNVYNFNDQTVKDELTVSLSESEGTGATSGINASYSLEDLQYGPNSDTAFPNGFYKVQVTYTVASA